MEDKNQERVISFLNFCWHLKENSIQDLKIRSYLEKSVMPLLLEAMAELAKHKFTFFHFELLTTIDQKTR